MVAIHRIRDNEVVWRLRSKNIKEVLKDAILNNVSVSNINLEGADLSGIQLNNVDLYGSNLRDANLSNSTLLKIGFGWCNLSGVSFDNTSLENCHLTGSNLSSCSLEGQKFTYNLRNINFEDSSLDGADLSGCHIDKSNFNNSSLDYVDFNASTIERCNFNNASIEFANFSGCIFKEISFKGNNLSGSTFEFASIQNINFENSILFRVNFYGANLRGAKFSGAKLHGVNFAYSKLEGADINLDDCYECNFEGTIFESKVSQSCIKTSLAANSKPNNFRMFAEQIFAGGAPTPDQMMSLIKDFNLKYVLSLDNAAGKLIEPLLKSQDVHQIFVPIEPVSHMTENLKYLIRNLRQILSYQPIYVHCTHGQDRTGFVLALYRILKFNYSPQQAITEAKRFNYGAGVSADTKYFWNKILETISTSKNPADVSADDDAYYESGFVVNENNFPYPNASIRTYPTNYPYNQSELSPEDRLEILKQIIHREDNNIPAVGHYDSMGPIKGTGPVENSGILLNI